MNKIAILTHSGTSVPEIITKKVNGNTIKIVPVIMSEENGVYTWLELKVRTYTYESLVSTIIGLKYTNDEITAIINNYLLEQTNEKYKDEFNELQLWRIQVKDWVKKHFNMQ